MSIKKFLVSIFIVSLMFFPNVASADFVSTLAFEGFFHYDGFGDLDPDEVFCDEGFNFDCGMTQVPGNAQNGGYFGLGGITGGLDLNLPENPQDLPWWLEGNIWIEYEEFIDGQEDGDEKHIDIHKNLGTFSLTQQEAQNFIDQIPLLLAQLDTDISGLTIEASGSQEDFQLLFGLEDNFLDFDPEEHLWVGFEGELVLIGHTDNVVPEPASMALLGTGLMGLVGLRRKKRG